MKLGVPTYMKYIGTRTKSNKKTVYHTSKTCKMIKTTVQEATDSEIEYHDLKLCDWCNPDIEHPNAQYEQDHGYQEALKEAAKDD